MEIITERLFLRELIESDYEFFQRWKLMNFALNMNQIQYLQRSI